MKRSKILGNTNQDTSTTRKTSRIGCRQVGYKLLAGTCIRLNLRKLSYKTARKTCKKDGARLAMPETEELDLALRNLVQKEGHNINFWIGLRNKGGFFLRKRHWLWEDGSKLGHYKGWNLGEPNGKRWVHLPEFNLCVRYYWAGRTGDPMWDDSSCTRKHGFICQASLE
ncbi:macrophage mannose receptor 1-like [Branchiostoma floridae]|uniref:Macrophage mannose receptor 1-like n=1 Tax=Branchiostoma floridae TaxID=7739 RepID=A0A9J7HPG7_BRAFL|nr:macrophage mannose receptor 1-like [Branchiostoma floridae]